MFRSARLSGAGAALLLALCVAGPVAGQTTIGVTSENGGYAAYPGLGTYAMGQTFVAPTSEPLTRFSFRYSTDYDLIFRLAAWNGGSPPVSYLFSQAVGPTSAMRWISFGLPSAGITLSPGSTYVAFMEVENGESVSMRSNDTDLYSQGGLTTGYLASGPLYVSGRGVDLLFQATFGTVTPEPVSLVLLGTGLLGLGLAGRRRRSSGR